MERRRPRRPAPHRRPLKQSPVDRAAVAKDGRPVRTPALHAWRALAHGAPASSPACAAPSAPQAVCCRPRRRAEGPRAGEDTGAPCLARSDSWSVAPWSAGSWSAGVLAGPAAPLVPQAVCCRPRGRGEGPWAGEDTGAPGLARSDSWSVGPMECGLMERRRPRRPAPHRWSLRQSSADRAAVPKDGRPVRTPALHAWRALTHGAWVPWSAGPWSAGVLAGLAAPLVPQAVCCRPRGRGEGPRAGEDTGAPCLARSDSWSVGPMECGPMERRRPRRPCRTVGSSGSLLPTARPCRRTVGR